ACHRADLRASPLDFVPDRDHGVDGPLHFLPLPSPEIVREPDRAGAFLPDLDQERQPILKRWILMENETGREVKWHANAVNRSLDERAVGRSRQFGGLIRRPQQLTSLVVPGDRVYHLSEARLPIS